jgi:hypothetical protein
MSDRLEGEKGSYEHAEASLVEEGAELVLRGLFVFKAIMQHVRQPASKILSFRIRDPQNLRFVNVCRMLVNRSLSIDELRKMISWLDKRISEESGNRLQVRHLRYDGESTKLREGVERPTTVVQLAKWSQERASEVVKKVTDLVFNDAPLKMKAGEEEAIVKQHLVKVSRYVSKIEHENVGMLSRSGCLVMEPNLIENLGCSDPIVS